MTATNTTNVAQTAQNTADAAKLLRDMAFVLKMTRRVKEEMTADRVPTRAKSTTADRALVA